MPSSEGSKEATVSGQGTVRLPRREDASRVAELYHQLGYRVSRREVLRRLEEIEQNEHHVGFVAESSHGEIVGFVHAYLRLLIESGLRAEVGGLIDFSWRLPSSGLGTGGVGQSISGPTLSGRGLASSTRRSGTRSLRSSRCSRRSSEGGTKTSAPHVQRGCEVVLRCVSGETAEWDMGYCAVEYGRPA